MERSLHMVFENSIGDNASLTIQNVKDELADEDVKNFMQLIIDKNVFASTGGDLVRIMSADITTKETTSLEVL